MPIWPLTLALFLVNSLTEAKELKNRKIAQVTLPVVQISFYPETTSIADLESKNCDGKKQKLESELSNIYYKCETSSANNAYVKYFELYDNNNLIVSTTSHANTTSYTQKLIVPFRGHKLLILY